MKLFVASFLLLLGASFMLLAAIGLARLPDVFTRMQATTKAPTLGIVCMLLGAVVYFGTFPVLLRALVVIAFVFLTAPVAAHMIGRAAYFVGVPLWRGTVRDDLKGRYDQRTHRLSSGLEGETGAPDESPRE